MVLLVVAPDYPTYRHFLVNAFPYFRPHYDGKDFVWVDPKRSERFMSFETGTPYLVVGGITKLIPDWFQLRFTRLDIVGQPGEARWAPGTWANEPT